VGREVGEDLDEIGLSMVIAGVGSRVQRDSLCCCL
jgi:hypothetical protein